MQVETHGVEDAAESYIERSAICIRALPRHSCLGLLGLWEVLWRNRECCRDRAGVQNRGKTCISILSYERQIECCSTTSPYLI
jgi:hypothetical protein